MTESVALPPFGSSAMPEYRVYFIEADGRIYQPPQIIKCADDQDATEKARQFIDGKDVQVWQMSRLVAKFPRK